MKDHIFSDLVRDYLKGNLSMVEMERFEQALFADRDLQKEVALQRAEMEAGEGLLAEETRHLFKHWKSEAVVPSANQSNLKPIYWVALILGLCLLTGELYTIFQVPEGTPPANTAPVQQQIVAPTRDENTPVSVPGITPEQDLKTTPSTDQKKSAKHPTEYAALALKHFKEPVFSNFRSGSRDTASGPFEKAQAAYLAAQYEEVLRLLKQPLPQQQQSADFLSACAFFHLKRYEEAAAQFSTLIAANSRKYKFQSEWSLLLCRVAVYPKYKMETLKQLDDMNASPDHPYYEPAKRLKKSLPIQ